MEFSLTPEQEMLRESIRDFALKEIAPHSRRWDEDETFPVELVEKMGDLGIMGVLVDPQLGGAGLGYLEYVIVVEEISRVDGSIGLPVAAHNSLCTNHIDLKGSEEQKKNYLSALASGKSLGAWALTEPGSGSDAAAAQTRAVWQEGAWVLNGTKNFCTHGSCADVYVVLADTDQAQGKDGFSAFIVEKGTLGLVPGKKESKLGCRASDTASLTLEDCRVPGSNLLGKVNQGFRDALQVLDGGRISVAAMALGIAQGALDCGLRYSQEREQFGQRIAQFQAIQWKLADMATRIEAAGLLTYQAAWTKQQSRKPIPKLSSMAKLYAGELAVWAAEEGHPDPWWLRLHQGLSAGEILAGCQAVHHRGRHQRNPAIGDRARTPVTQSEPLLGQAPTRTAGGTRHPFFR